jgi:hypothetical protein
MPAKDVKAYVKRNKNDAADAEEIDPSRTPSVLVGVDPGHLEHVLGDIQTVVVICM